MVIKQYRFADIGFRIISPSNMIADSRFEVFEDREITETDYVFEIFSPEEGREPTDTEPIVLERSGSHLKAYMDTSLLPRITVAQFLSGVKADKLLPEKNRVMLHCSYVLYQEQALLFCAPSGTGKSTQAAFWHQVREAHIINEDRAILGKANGAYYAYGCWAMGHGTVCRNISAPIRAIILLGQGSENCVCRLRAVEVMKRILPQCSFDEQSHAQRRKIIEIIADLIEAVPILSFDCVNNASSVEELEKYL